MSTESMVILPDVSSTNLNNAVTMELFPAPVLPTTPIFSHGLVSNEIPFRDGMRCSLKIDHCQKTFIKYEYGIMTYLK